MPGKELKITSAKTDGPTLSQAVERTAQKLVNCAGCTKCCEKGIAYVLPEEQSRLESMDVPLIEIDGVSFIKRKNDGSCSMLDKENRRCSIYEDRPLCCRAFPLDIFSRRGHLEWGVYTYCPTDRLIPITRAGNKVALDHDVAVYLTSALEKHLTQDVLRFVEREDKIVSQVEILDEHKNDYVILGDVLKRITD
jgi:Fe-S-cluster containining protein